MPTKKEIAFGVGGAGLVAGLRSARASRSIVSLLSRLKRKSPLSFSDRFIKLSKRQKTVALKPGQIRRNEKTKAALQETFRQQMKVLRRQSSVRRGRVA